VREGDGENKKDSPKQRQTKCLTKVTTLTLKKKDGKEYGCGREECVKNC